MIDRTKPGSLFNSLVSVATLLTLAAVVLSAYIRLESIGLGCEGWPDCFGQLPATRVHSVVPGTMAGVVHRFTAGLLGMIVVAITLLALSGRRPRGAGLAAPLAIFALTVFLSVLGFISPAPGIPAVTFSNLLGGMAMLALLWWTGRRSVAVQDAGDDRASNLRPWALLGLFIVSVQIALGALTSATFAGPACTLLSGCNGDPGGIISHLQGFDPFARLGVDEQGRVVINEIQRTLHTLHRLGAILAMFYLVWLAVMAMRQDCGLRTTGICLMGLLVLQGGLGIAAVLNGLPLLVVTAHNAVAAMLLLACVNLCHLLTPSGVQSHP